MVTIDKFNFNGKKAIVRVDFNVPLDENGKVTRRHPHPRRTSYAQESFGRWRSVIMMSHMGKPKGKVNPKLSLSQIVPNVSERLGVESEIC